MSERIGDGEEKAGACMIYDCDERYVGVYYHDGGVEFFSNGDTRQECLDDMIETVNNLPRDMHKIRNDEAELVDVVPLKRMETDDD